jgi:hypothetical protein
MLSDFIFVSIAAGICALSTDEESKKKRIGIIPKKRFVLFILFSDLLNLNISLKHIHIEEKGILFHPYFILAEIYIKQK